jgi:hypothetical protein
MDPLQNIQEALDLAKNIFKFVSNEEIFKKLSPDERQKIMVKKYPAFATAYPIILRFIACDLKYNEIAFKKFFQKLLKDPGKGMQGFIECQSEYAKQLYIEDEKANGRHWNYKTAKSIYDINYQSMKDNMKKLKDQEYEARNEFTEEKEKNLIQKRKELFNFLSEIDEPFEIPEVNEPINKKQEEPNIEELTKNLGKSELILLVRKLRDYRISLIEQKAESLSDFDPNLNLDQLEKNQILTYIKNIRENIFQLENSLVERNFKKIENEN